MEKSVVAREVAEAEFERFGEMMELDFDTNAMDDEDRRGFEQHRRRLVAAIMSGALTIDEKGQPEFTPRRSGEWEGVITFYEPDGAAYLAMDRQKKNQDMHKFYAVMAAMTKQNAGVLAKLKGSDAKLCQAVVALFLA